MNHAFLLNDEDIQQALNNTNNKLIVRKLRDVLCNWSGIDPSLSNNDLYSNVSNVLKASGYDTTISSDNSLQYFYAILWFGILKNKFALHRFVNFYKNVNLYKHVANPWTNQKYVLSIEEYRKSTIKPDRSMEQIDNRAIERIYGEINHKMMHLQNLDSCRIKLLNKIALKLKDSDRYSKVKIRNLLSIIANRHIPKGRNKKLLEINDMHKLKEEIESFKKKEKELTASREDEMEFYKYIKKRISSNGDFDIISNSNSQLFSAMNDISQIISKLNDVMQKLYLMDMIKPSQVPALIERSILTLESAKNMASNNLATEEKGSIANKSDVYGDTNDLNSLKLATAGKMLDSLCNINGVNNALTKIRVEHVTSLDKIAVTSSKHCPYEFVNIDS